MSFANNIRRQAATADTLQKIIFVNVLVYLGFAVIRALMKLFMGSLDEIGRAHV